VIGGAQIRPIKPGSEWTKARLPENLRDFINGAQKISLMMARAKLPIVDVGKD
jgi:hypothetical protein